MVKITQDNGNIILLTLLISIEQNKINNKNGADSEVLYIRGIDKTGEFYGSFKQDQPEAIRTIEFLP